jgi:hypothetical protein
MYIVLDDAQRQGHQVRESVHQKLWDVRRWGHKVGLTLLASLLDFYSTHLLTEGSQLPEASTCLLTPQ